MTKAGRDLEDIRMKFIATLQLCVTPNQITGQQIVTLLLQAVLHSLNSRHCSCMVVTHPILIELLTPRRTGPQRVATTCFMASVKDACTHSGVCVAVRAVGLVQWIDQQVQGMTLARPTIMWHVHEP